MKIIQRIKLLYYNLVEVAFYETFSPSKPPIVIICMPKTGSTFLYRKLSRYANYKIGHLRIHHEIQEFHPFLKYRTRHSVISQLHNIASEYSIRQLNSVNAKVIILYRNLYDLVISMHDFLHSDEYRNNIERKGFAQSFGGVFYEDFYKLPKNKQYDYLINYDAPALIRFFASWKRYEKMLDHKPYWISYEKFFSDKHKYFTDILEYCDLPIDKDKIKKVLEFKESTTRFNKGIVRNKGNGELSEDQINTIKELLSYYSDFSDDLT